MSEEKYLPAVIEQPDLLSEFLLPKYEPHIYLTKRTKDFKRYDSRSECEKCMRNHVDSCYNEAAKYLDATSVHSVARSAVDYYWNGMESAFSTNCEELRAGLSGEDYEALQKVCGRRRELLESLNSELTDGDYYTLYDRDYFYGLADIEELTVGTKQVGILFPHDVDVVKYYYRKGWEVPQILEKNLNELTRTMWNFAYEEYRRIMADPAAEILRRYSKNTNKMEETV